eukprot:Opistho-2@38532
MLLAKCMQDKKKAHAAPGETTTTTTTPHVHDVGDACNVGDEQQHSRPAVDAPRLLKLPDSFYVAKRGLESGAPDCSQRFLGLLKRVLDEGNKIRRECASLQSNRIHSPGRCAGAE